MGLLTVDMSHHTGRCVCCRFTASLHVCGLVCTYCGLPTVFQSQNRYCACDWPLDGRICSN